MFDAAVGVVLTDFLIHDTGCSTCRTELYKERLRSELNLRIPRIEHR